jgi:hypothetical protein
MSFILSTSLTTMRVKVTITDRGTDINSVLRALGHKWMSFILTGKEFGAAALRARIL